MVRCAKCSAELQPTWKFCIYCGTRVAPAADLAATESVIAAIRAGAAAADEPRTITVLALFGWALGGLLGVLALVAAVLLLTS